MSSSSSYAALSDIEKRNMDALIQKIKSRQKLEESDLTLSSLDQRELVFGEETKFLPGIFDASGLNALHWACTVGHNNAINLLVRRHMDINALTRSGKSPLEILIENDHPEFALSFVRSRELDRAAHRENYKRAFFGAIAKEASTQDVRVKGNFSILVDAFFEHPAATACLRDGHYVFSDPLVLEKMHQTRLNQIIAKIVEGQELTKTLNLPILFKPEFIHKDKLCKAILALPDTDPKKLHLLRLIVGRNPTAPLKGDNSFEAFFWKSRWFGKCKVTTGTLAKLQAALTLLQPPAPKTTARVAISGMGGTPGAGASAPDKRRHCEKEFSAFT